eukprot:8288898-Alexandrium_andersonii.AAC.1
MDYAGSAAEKRADVRWLPIHWDARIPEDVASIATILCEGIEALCPTDQSLAAAARAAHATTAHLLQQHALPPTSDPSHLFP